MASRTSPPNGAHRDLIVRADRQLARAEREIRETRRILRLVRDAGEFTERFNQRPEPT